MTSRMPPRPCIICSKVADIEQACPNCLKASYCSLECRQTDAPIHVLMCALTEEFQLPKKDHSIRAIIFPSTKSKPRFVWIERDMNLKPVMQPINHLIKLLRNENEDESPNMMTELLVHNDMRDTNLLKREGLLMVSRENNEDELYLNKAIRAVVDECKKSDVRSEVISAWRKIEKEKTRKEKAKMETSSEDIEGTPDNNNQVVLKCEDPKELKEPRSPKPKFPRGNVIFIGLDSLGVYRSLNHVDFRHIVDYLRLYRNQKSNQSSSRRFRSRLVQGIRINCIGDINKHDLDPYQVVYFPQDHPIFQQPDGDPFAVPQVLGGMCRFKLMGFPRAKFQRKAQLENLTISRMMMRLKPGSKSWGLIDKKWEVPEGSVLIVRADREHLDMIALRSLLLWVRRQQTAIHDLRGSAPASQQAFLSEVRKRWREACRAWIKANKSGQEQQLTPTEDDANSKKADEKENPKTNSLIIKLSVPKLSTLLSKPYTSTQSFAPNFPAELCQLEASTLPPKGEVQTSSFEPEVPAPSIGLVIPAMTHELDLLTQPFEPSGLTISREPDVQDQLWDSDSGSQVDDFDYIDIPSNHIPEDDVEEHFDTNQINEDSGDIDMSHLPNHLPDLDTNEKLDTNQPSEYLDDIDMSHLLNHFPSLNNEENPFVNHQSEFLNNINMPSFTTHIPGFDSIEPSNSQQTSDFEWMLQELEERRSSEGAIAGEAEEQTDYY